MKFSLYLIGLVAIGYYLLGYSTGFSDDAVEHAKNSIKEEYEKRPGRIVDQVSLLRKSRHELTGFIKFRENGIQKSLDCSATMDQSGGRYIWRCGR